MAQGDIRTEIAEVPAESFVAIQPASGEHWRVEDVFAAGDGTNAGFFEYFDGMRHSPSELTSIDDVDLNSYRMRKASAGILPLYINNSLHIRVYNHSLTFRWCGLVALQIK